MATPPQMDYTALVQHAADVVSTLCPGSLEAKKLIKVAHQPDHWQVPEIEWQRFSSDDQALLRVGLEALNASLITAIDHHEVQEIEQLVLHLGNEIHALRERKA